MAEANRTIRSADNYPLGWLVSRAGESVLERGNALDSIACVSDRRPDRGPDDLLNIDNKFHSRKRRKKFWITCEWCGERKQTADPKARWCSDQHRVYGNRAKKRENVTARVVTV
jgi:hypothetical protein